MAHQSPVTSLRSSLLKARAALNDNAQRTTSSRASTPTQTPTKNTLLKDLIRERIEQDQRDYIDAELKQQALDSLKQELEPLVRAELTSALEPHIRAELTAHYSTPSFRKTVRRDLENDLRDQILREIRPSVEADLRFQLRPILSEQIQQELRNEMAASSNEMVTPAASDTGRPETEGFISHSSLAEPDSLDSTFDPKMVKRGKRRFSDSFDDELARREQHEVLPKKMRMMSAAEIPGTQDHVSPLLSAPLLDSSLDVIGESHTDALLLGDDSPLLPDALRMASHNSPTQSSSTSAWPDSVTLGRNAQVKSEVHAHDHNYDFRPITQKRSDSSEHVGDRQASFELEADAEVDPASDDEDENRSEGEPGDEYEDDIEADELDQVDRLAFDANADDDDDAYSDEDEADGQDDIDSYTQNVEARAGLSHDKTLLPVSSLASVPMVRGGSGASAPEAIELVDSD